MITYKGSDVQFSWDQQYNSESNHTGFKTCGYVKEGAELEIEDEIDSDMVKVDRKKRQVDQFVSSLTRTRCPLLLVADFRFFQEMGASNTKTTINYLVRIETKINLFSLQLFSFLR